jgi:hypothetical protein
LTASEHIGRSEFGWLATRTAATGPGLVRVCHPIDPPAATTRRPGGSASEHGRRFGRWLPLACRVVGLREVDGCNCGTSPAARTRRPSSPSLSARNFLSVSCGCDRSLILVSSVYVRLRSPTFIGVQINATAQVANVDAIRRTIIPRPENRKVDGSTPLLATPLMR